jgi:hypothetical protein
LPVSVVILERSEDPAFAVAVALAFAIARFTPVEPAESQHQSTAGTSQPTHSNPHYANQLRSQTIHPFPCQAT